ncbi:Heterochromatin protein 1 [Orchesella cincta]|uniref:Heterochromatin protein 1 n=1 Tax=Orchesella cincta TaxID=48709 RepID=A0A1D2MGJ0_ORCCI|nr:Heterochromatin protein 1 [Orchesella cincta]
MDSISSLSLGSEEYTVEEILKKRIGADGKPEYFLKWEGYGHDETLGTSGKYQCRALTSHAKIPSTEPSSNQRKKPSGRADEVKSRDYREKNESDDKPNVSGFDRGLEADEIIGANNENGGINVLVKWKGENGVEMVPSSVARFKCPDVLIKFYEENFTFAMSSSQNGIQ